MKSELDKLKQALFRIDPIIEEGATIEETAEVLGISSSSVDKALQYVRKNAILLTQLDIDPNEFLTELSSILKTNTIQGKKAAGYTGGKKKTWNSEEAIKIAHLFLADGLTLRKAAPKFGHSKSILLEILNSSVVKSNLELYQDVKLLFKINLMLKNVAGQARTIEEYNQWVAIKEMLMEKYQEISLEKGYLGESR